MDPLLSIDLDTAHSSASLSLTAVAADLPLTALAHATAAADALQLAIRCLVVELRHHQPPASWAQVAAALGTSRQNAQQRYSRDL